MNNNRLNSSKLYTPIFRALFLALIIYMIYIIIAYATKAKIFSYEVKSGSLAKVNNYEGIAVRSEELISSNSAGNITYFIREGEHVGISDYVYSINQSGNLDTDMTSAKLADNKFSNEDLSELKNEISNFTNLYSDKEFSRTYDFLYDINGVVLKYANANLLDELAQANASSDFIKMATADKTGYVVFNKDGYEDISINSISSESFNKDNYEKNQITNGTLISEGDTAYKLITSDTWQLIIPVDEERAAEFEELGYLDVKFLKDRRKLKGKVEIFQNLDDYYCSLTFNSSVQAYCTDRFIDIEIITNEEKGLKIPLDSIVHKEFYIVPTTYAIDEGPENKYYFLRKTFLEDGTLSSEKVLLEVYAEEDGNYYIDDAALKPGDYLLTFDSALNEYPVATKGELVGVYNMNMGYADFRRINILYQNDEYAIVESNTSYGLKEYDYIVLDAIAVTDNELVFE